MARTKQRSNNEQELTHIREDLDSLRENVISLGRSIRHDVKESALTRWGRVRDQSERSLERVEERVREHPTRSMLTAFGAGLILSTLMRSR